MVNLYAKKIDEDETMKWRNLRRSQNVQDRRAQGGGGRGAAVGGGGLGLLAIVAIGWFLGVDLSGLLGQGGGSSSIIQAGEGQEVTAADEERAQFSAAVLGFTEDVWAAVLPRTAGIEYEPATLVLFKGTTQSQCGGASAATGPFYCPPEEAIYIDTNFFVTMERRLGAGGDFAAAYVIAHEVAHHVQNELGILSTANRERANSSEARSNQISVMIELQADCFSGVWARFAQAEGLLEAGDLQEAMNAAEQIGDDTLARNAGQAVRPHTFTHGTSEQRQRWFARGFETGDPTQCDTFSAAQL